MRREASRGEGPAGAVSGARALGGGCERADFMREVAVGVEVPEAGGVSIMVAEEECESLLYSYCLIFQE